MTGKPTLGVFDNMLKQSEKIWMRCDYLACELLWSKDIKRFYLTCSILNASPLLCGFGNSDYYLRITEPVMYLSHQMQLRPLGFSGSLYFAPGSRITCVTLWYHVEAMVRIGCIVPQGLIRIQAQSDEAMSAVGGHSGHSQPWYRVGLLSYSVASQVPYLQSQCFWIQCFRL